MFLHYKNQSLERAKIPLNLTSAEGLNTPQRCEFNMKHVVLYVGHMYKPFWTKKNWPGWQGGSGKVKIGQNIAQNRPRFWLWSPREAPKWVEDSWKGFKSTRGSWGYHLGSVSGVLDPFRGLQRAPKPKTRPILGNILTYFDLPWPPLPTRSNFFGSKWLVHVSHI